MNYQNFEIPINLIYIGIAIFLICFGLSFLSLDQQEKKVMKLIKRIEKIEQTLQNTQARSS